jgi:ferredoxin-type protein NapG
MDRRDFFRSAVKRTSKEVVQHLDAKVTDRASHWIRPPYAIGELEFLLSCTRCGDCTAACPHDVIFPLSARLGTQVMGTPAMDLLNKGCHLCQDWPCVSACEKAALVLPEVEEEEGALPLPKMAVASINTETCFPYSGPECGACDAACPVPGALTWDMQRPVIDAAICVGCGLCRQICIVDPSAINITPIVSQELVSA